MLSKEEFVLAVLSASENNRYTPVQIQKIFFILDREIPEHISGPVFDFKPYDYGPFDSTIYQIMEMLIEKGYVSRHGESIEKSRSYSLTTDGRVAGNSHLKTLNDSANSYIADVISFVSKLGFSQLVQAIYKKYPDMKVNSVFSNT